MKTKYETVEFVNDNGDSVCGELIYYCVSPSRVRIGVIYRGTKRMVFAPIKGRVFCEGELRDIADFLDQLNKENTDAAPVDAEVIHSYFGLSYANYLVLPRTVLQTMPEDWQSKFVALLHEIEVTIDEEWEPAGGYQVQAKGANGKFAFDRYANYERGRRRLQVKESTDAENK